MILKYGSGPVLIQQKLIGFEAISDKSLSPYIICFNFFLKRRGHWIVKIVLVLNTRHLIRWLENCGDFNLI